MANPYRVPGVYYEPQPRQDELPFVRTDVVGFIGFEPRVRGSTLPSRLLGDATAALNAATAAANGAVPAVGNVRLATQAIVAGGVFGPVPVPLQGPALQAALQADAAASALDDAASFVLIPTFRSSLWSASALSRAAAAAARQSAAAAIAADAAAADAAAASAQVTLAAAVAAALNGVASAQNAIAAAALALPATAAVRVTTATVVSAGAFPPVNPDLAAVVAAGAACPLVRAAVQAAIVPLGTAVSDAAAELIGALQDAADAAEEAADASSRPAATAAGDDASVADGEAKAGEATIRGAIIDLERAPPIGHDFAVSVSGFQLDIDGRRARVLATPYFTLSSAANAIPVADGGQIIFSLVAVRDEKAPIAALLSVAGPAVAAGNAAPPIDAAIEAALPPGTPPPKWVRIADITVARTGRTIRQIVHPLLSLTRCDDWRDYLLAFGEPVTDGTFLASAVRAYFANGGRRCFIATVQRPDFDDAAGLAAARFDLVGVAGESEASSTGLARLLLVDDVMVVDVPDLYARHVGDVAQRLTLPPPDREACFERCADIIPPGAALFSRDVDWGDPLYAEPDVLETQLALLRRCIAEPWAVLLLLSPPLELDPTVGVYAPPTVAGVEWWRQALSAVLDGEPQGAACAALYFPWVFAQDRVGATIELLPPTAFAAGVIARRDLARGPHVAPANETVRGVVGLSRPITDDVHGDLYESPTNINVLRPFAGYGIQLWGARTLSPDTWLRYVPIRRCLSAIERRVRAALRELVFDPNAPFLWMQVTHVVLGVLMPLFDAGAMRGSRPDEAFYVRCDETTMTADDVQNGRLICEVGVALAAPAEFVVFRVGRREGVIEIVE
jgi:hypothetical protein